MPIRICLFTFLLIFSFSKNALAFDFANSVWKALNEKYEQQSENKQIISGFISNRIYYNNVFDSDNRKNEYSDTYLKTRIGLNLRLNNNFSIKTVAKLEKVSQASETARRNQLSTGGGDRSFENHGAFIDELLLEYDYKKFSALAGKMETNFGNAWSSSNGVWVNEIAKIYDIDEVLGLGAIQRFGDKKDVGEYVFGLSVFTNDRKNLDNSTITKRDSDSKSDGKAGDSRGLESYVASMDIYYDFGQKHKWQEKLSYHFAYLNLAINERQNQSNVPANIDDQKAFVINMDYLYPFNKNWATKAFIEYSHINNFEGNIDKDSKLLTANLTTYFRDFYLTLARAKRKDFEVGGNGVDKYINEASIGYKFDKIDPILKGLSFTIGYNESETDDKLNPIKDQAFGLMIKHKQKF